MNRIMLLVEVFKCKETARLFDDIPVKRFRAVARAARIKLEMLNAAPSLNSLRVPPGNRLEQLRGNREGQYSKRINDQWRICFTRQENNAHQVEIVDYH